MTNRKLIASVRELLKMNSFDSIVSDRAILEELRKTSLKFIRQAMNVRKILGDPNIYSAIPCLEMINVPLSECCSFNSACTVARSKQKIPQIAGNNYGLFVEGVWDVEKRNKFLQTTTSGYENIKKLKLRNNNIYYWIFDNYLYVSEPDLELVAMSALFEDDIPASLLSCGNTDEDDCPENPYDADFKAPSYMLNDISKEVMNIMMQTFKRSVQDVGVPGADESK